MKKLVFLPAFLLVFLFACNNISSDKDTSQENSAPSGNGKLYIRTFWWAMNNTMEISWVYLGKDGTIVKNPKHGNAPVDLIQEKKDNASYTGTYTVNGEEMNITWSTGQKETWLIQTNNGVFTSLNKGPVTIANPLPEDFRFEKSFSAATFFEGENLMHTIEFFKDGSCVFKKFNGMDAAIADGTKGTYSINKNTIVVQLENKKAVANIGMLNGTNDTIKHLIINTNYQDL